MDGGLFKLNYQTNISHFLISQYDGNIRKFASFLYIFALARNE